MTHRVWCIVCWENKCGLGVISRSSVIWLQQVFVSSYLSRMFFLCREHNGSLKKSVLSTNRTPLCTECSRKVSGQNQESITEERLEIPGNKRSRKHNYRWVCLCVFSHQFKPSQILILLSENFYWGGKNLSSHMGPKLVSGRSAVCVCVPESPPSVRRKHATQHWGALVLCVFVCLCGCAHKFVNPICQRRGNIRWKSPHLSPLSAAFRDMDTADRPPCFHAQL